MRTASPIRWSAALPALSYQSRNAAHARLSAEAESLLAELRARRLPAIVATSELRAKVYRAATGTVEDLGVLSRKVVTTAGVTYLAQAFTNATEPELFKYHAMGTGGAAEAIGDVALGTEVESRDGTGAQSNPAGGQYRTIGIITATAPRAVTEHGIFSASTAGTLLDRSVFAVINLATGDSIQFTYTLTFTAGG